MTTAALAPTFDQDRIFRHALQDLLQMGLRVAAVSARLAEVEGQAVEALAAAAIDAAQIVAQPHSLESAIEAGRIADASEAARDAAATRIALITASFERAARAVRRTVALGRRIEDPRPFLSPHPHDPAAPLGLAEAAHAHAAARVAERLCDDLADRLDAAELGDELGARPTLEVIGDICRDLGHAVLPGLGTPAVAGELVQAPTNGQQPGSAGPHVTPGWPPPPDLPEPET